MVDLTTIIVLAGALTASFFMAWTIGAGSAGSTPFAPAVGANAISVMRAAFVVGLLIFLGAVLQGANVSEAVGRELIMGVELSTGGAAIALTIAAFLVLIGVFTGYPIATAFTVTGAVIGVGLAMGGLPAWGKYAEITALWTLTPIVGGVTAYAIAVVLRDAARAERRVITILGAFVGGVIANIEFAVLGRSGAGGTVAGDLAHALPGEPGTGMVMVTLGFAAAGGGLAWYRTGRGVVRALQHFTLVMGALVAFSAGGSQVGLAVGPLLPILGGVPLLGVLVFGGVGLLVGAWTGATRLIKAVSQDYSSLGPRRSIAALIPSFVIAQIAILFGIPVSFNQIVVSAIIGSGAAAHGTSSISRKKIGYTFAAWAGSFTGAGVVGYAGYTFLTMIL